MKKYVALTFIIVYTILLPFNAYAVTVTSVLAWGSGQWTGSTRIIPSLVRVVGGPTAGAFYRTAFPIAGIVIMAGSFLGQYAYDHFDDQTQFGAAVRALAAQVGYRKESGQLQKGSPAGEGSLTPNAAALNSVQTFINSVGSPKTVHWFSTYALAAAAHGTNYWCSYGGAMTYINSGTNQANAEIVAVTRHNVTHPPGTHTGIGETGYMYMIFAYPKGSGSVTAETQWTNKTPAQMAADLATALGDGTLTDTEKSLWSTLENEIARAILDSDGGILGLVNPVNSKTLDQNIKEQTEAAINADSTPAESDTGIIDAITSLPQRIVDAISVLITETLNTVKSWIGVEDEVADVSQQDIDEAENDNVIDTSVITGEVDAAKTQTEGYLDALFTSISGLSTRMKDKVESMVNVGSGVCSLSFSSYGQTAVLDFCSIDFTVIKAAILFVATVAAAMIIIM